MPALVREVADEDKPVLQVHGDAVSHAVSLCIGCGVVLPYPCGKIGCAANASLAVYVDAGLHRFDPPPRRTPLTGQASR